MNQGVVDYEGHWHPIFSTGCDGIDDDDRFDCEVSKLKSSLGFSVRSVDAQVREKEHQVIRDIFGDEWYKEEDPY